MHLEAGDPDHEAGSEKGVLAVVVTYHVAHVLAEVALDAFAELDDAVHVLLLHAPGLRVTGIPLAGGERRDSLVDLVVPADVGHQVAEDGEGRIGRTLSSVP